MPLDPGGGWSYGRGDLDISGPGAAGTARGPAPRNRPRCIADCLAASRCSRGWRWHAADRGRLLGVARAKELVRCRNAATSNNGKVDLEYERAKRLRSAERRAPVADVNRSRRYRTRSFWRRSHAHIATAVPRASACRYGTSSSAWQSPSAQRQRERSVHDSTPCMLTALCRVRAATESWCGRSRWPASAALNASFDRLPSTSARVSTASCVARRAGSRRA